MSRREWLNNLCRLALLRWRVVRGQALPTMAASFLGMLDRWAAERALDRPWTQKASARVDRIIERRGRDR